MPSFFSIQAGGGGDGDPGGGGPAGASAGGGRGTRGAFTVGATTVGCRPLPRSVIEMLLVIGGIERNPGPAAVPMASAAQLAAFAQQMSQLALWWGSMGGQAPPLVEPSPPLPMAPSGPTTMPHTWADRIRSGEGVAQPPPAPRVASPRAAPQAPGSPPAMGARFVVFDGHRWERPAGSGPHWARNKLRKLERKQLRQQQQQQRLQWQKRKEQQLQRKEQQRAPKPPQQAQAKQKAVQQQQKQQRPKSAQKAVPIPSPKSKAVPPPPASAVSTPAGRAPAQPSKAEELLRKQVEDQKKELATLRRELQARRASPAPKESSPRATELALREEADSLRKQLADRPESEGGDGPESAELIDSLLRQLTDAKKALAISAAASQDDAGPTKQEQMLTVQLAQRDTEIATLQARVSFSVNREEAARASLQRNQAFLDEARASLAEERAHRASGVSESAAASDTVLELATERDTLRAQVVSLEDALVKEQDANGVGRKSIAQEVRARAKEILDLNNSLLDSGRQLREASDTLARQKTDHELALSKMQASLDAARQEAALAVAARDAAQGQLQSEMQQFAATSRARITEAAESKAALEEHRARAAADGLSALTRLEAELRDSHAAEVARLWGQVRAERQYLIDSYQHCSRITHSQRASIADLQDRLRLTSDKLTHLEGEFTDKSTGYEALLAAKDASAETLRGGLRQLLDRRAGAYREVVLQLDQLHGASAALQAEKEVLGHDLQSTVLLLKDKSALLVKQQEAIYWSEGKRLYAESLAQHLAIEGDSHRSELHSLRDMLVAQVAGCSEATMSRRALQSELDLWKAEVSATHRTIEELQTRNQELSGPAFEGRMSLALGYTRQFVAFCRAGRATPPLDQARRYWCALITSLLSGLPPPTRGLITTAVMALLETACGPAISGGALEYVFSPEDLVRCDPPPFVPISPLPDGVTVELLSDEEQLDAGLPPRVTTSDHEALVEYMSEQENEWGAGRGWNGHGEAP